MTTTPDFRALCAELLQELCCHYRSWELKEGHCSDAMNRARAALATPPPKPPTDEEIAAAIQKGADQEFYATVKALTKYCDAGVELTDSDAREVLYELRRPHIALDCWGNEKQ